MSIEITGINHLGLVSKDLEQTKKFFRDFLNLPFLGEELVAEQFTNTIMYDANPAHTSTRLELLENQEGEEGPIARYQAKKGSGIHHLALNCKNLDAALEELKSKGVQLIDETPRAGAHNTRIAFIHPKATGGLLIELVEN